MDIVAELLSKYSKSLINNATSSITESYDLINTIKTEMSKLSREISQAHFESAMQSLAAFRNSNNRKGELAICAGHLRDAFNIAKKQRSAKKRQSHIFGLISTEEDFLNKSQLILLNIYLVIICHRISEIYRYIGEEKNSSYWESERQSIQSDLIPLLDIECEIRSNDYESAKDSSDDNYSEIGIFIILEKVKPRYISSQSYDENFTSPSGATHKITNKKLSLSREGKEFIKRLTS
jgi:hypothetical protein